jgi:hypothetical protein
MKASQDQNHQWVQFPGVSNEMILRVQKWVETGRTLMWFPIFSRENFPEVPPEALFYAEQSHERYIWLIKQVEDFLRIPDGITGWLMPEGDTDTDVVVGLWEGEVHFLKTYDRRTGEPMTLRSDAAWLAEESSDSQIKATQP